MLEITFGANDEIILAGRFDAMEAEKARRVFLTLDDAKTVDFSRLDYISSAGLGVLLAAQKRLSEQGKGLRLVNVNGHIRDVFHFSGFDQVFQIE
ncbi:MAG TPA: STAS domain-containing protein [Thermoanaerobaculia bacterium]|nr:STAS domain-containing protein [Thermoanaerobaculia bacterium]